MNERADEAACVIEVAYGDASPAGLPVSVGVPFPAGAVQDAGQLAVRGPDGEMRPAGGRVLVRHADGSIRWCLVSFGARQAGAHEVLWTGVAAAPADPAVGLRQREGVWSIDNGRLRVTVCETGPGVLGEIVCDGHSYLKRPEDLQFCVDGWGWGTGRTACT